MHVGAHHGIKFIDHCVIDAANVSSSFHGIKGTGVAPRGNASFQHAGLQIARVQRVQGGPLGDSNPFGVNGVVPFVVGNVGRMHNVHALVQKERFGRLCRVLLQPIDPLMHGVPIFLMGGSISFLDGAVGAAVGRFVVPPTVRRLVVGEACVHGPTVQPDI